MVELVNGSILLKKETQAQVFSRNFWVIFKNTYFIEQLRMTGSEKG